MAKIFKAPIPPPAWNINGSHADNMRAENEYLETLRTQAKKQNPNAAEVGGIIRIPYADGHAQYMVWSTKPLGLIWLQLDDAWRADPALERGLNLTDIRKRLDRSRAMTAMFSEGNKQKKQTKLVP